MNLFSEVQVSQFVWVFAKWIIYLVLFVLSLGLIFGIFTYGRPPRRKKRSDGIMDDAFDTGMEITHMLIDWMRGKLSTRSGSWLNDQQILAMMRGMKPSEFEEFIARMFEKLGYKTQIVGGSGDGGVDIDMVKDGRQYLVQCKKFITRKVTPHDVRDFYGAIGDRRIDGKGFFITTNIFTREAERFAEGKALELVDGNLLIQWVRESGVLVPTTANNDRSSDAGVEHCPVDGGDLVIRTNHENGNRFLGCSNFPKCRYTKAL